MALFSSDIDSIPFYLTTKLHQNKDVYKRVSTFKEQT